MIKYQRYYLPGRLNLIFEAIDSRDTDLYWTDRKGWLRKHGYSLGGQYIPRRMVKQWKENQG